MRVDPSHGSCTGVHTHVCVCMCVCANIRVCMSTCVPLSEPESIVKVRSGLWWTPLFAVNWSSGGGAAPNRADPRVRWDTELKGNEVKTRSLDSVRRWLSKSAVSEPEPTQLPPFLASHNLSCLGHASIWLHLVYSFIDCYVLFHV